MSDGDSTRGRVDARILAIVYLLALGLLIAACCVDPASGRAYRFGSVIGRLIGYWILAAFVGLVVRRTAQRYSPTVKDLTRIALAAYFLIACGNAFRTALERQHKQRDERQLYETLRAIAAGDEVAPSTHDLEELPPYEAMGEWVRRNAVRNNGSWGRFNEALGLIAFGDLLSPSRLANEEGRDLTATELRQYRSVIATLERELRANTEAMGTEMERVAARLQGDEREGFIAGFLRSSAESAALIARFIENQRTSCAQLETALRFVREHASKMQFGPDKMLFTSEDDHAQWTTHVAALEAIGTTEAGIRAEMDAYQKRSANSANSR